MSKDASKQTLSERVAQVGTGWDKSGFSVRPDFPRNIMIELTNACNHACVFCANPHMQRKVGRLEPQLLDRIMVEAHAAGSREIGFYSTGEPLVHKDLETFIRRAHEIGYDYIYISTNGSVGGPDRFRALIDAGLDSIKFSINGGSRETYRLIHGKDDWDKVLENLRFCIDYRQQTDRDYKLYITYVITRQTEHEVDAFNQQFASVVDEIFFNQSDAQQGNMAGAQELYGYREYAVREGGGTCPLPFNRAHVTCEGFLTLCCVDYQNYLAVADLNTVSLVDGWYSDAFIRARQQHLDDNLIGTLCGNCWLGRKDPIEPLNADMASHLDFEAFYVEQREKVKNRLTAQTDVIRLEMPD